MQVDNISIRKLHFQANFAKFLLKTKSSTIVEI